METRKVNTIKKHQMEVLEDANSTGVAGAGGEMNPSEYNYSVL